MSTVQSPGSPVEVVVERLIAAPPARIYKALTEASELEKWFFTDARTNPKVGGDYRIRWRSDATPEKDHDRFGKYLELIPNAKVSFEWQGENSGPCGMQGVGITVVTITLTPVAEGTLVRLVHSGWPTTEIAQKTREGHNGGWTFYLENLQRFLSGGEDRRAENHGQTVKVSF